MWRSWVATTAVASNAQPAERRSLRCSRGTRVATGAGRGITAESGGVVASACACVARAGVSVVREPPAASMIEERRKGRGRPNALPMPRRRATCAHVATRAVRLLVEQVEQELLHARVFPLAKPEDRLLAQLRILLAARDLEQLVRRLGFLPLRIHEEHLVLHLGLTRQLVVQWQQLLQLDAALAGVEERLLSRLHLLLLVAGDADQPGRAIGRLLNGDRLDHRFAELGAGRLPEQAAEVLALVAAAPALTDVVDRPGAQLRGNRRRLAEPSHPESRRGAT